MFEEILYCLTSSQIFANESVASERRPNAHLPPMEMEWQKNQKDNGTIQWVCHSLES